MLSIIYFLESNTNRLVCRMFHDNHDECSYPYSKHKINCFVCRMCRNIHNELSLKPVIFFYCKHKVFTVYIPVFLMSVVFGIIRRMFSLLNASRCL